MSVEANKELVRQWFAAVNRGDEAGILALLTEDFRFESMMRRPEWMHYRWNRAEFAAAPGGMSRVMATPITMQPGEMIAEGDRVSVEATSDAMMRNGKRYDNAYHFAIRLREGLISEVREYSCSALAVDCFGQYDPTVEAAELSEP